MGSGHNLIRGDWVNGLLQYRVRSTNAEIARINTSGIYIPSTGTLEVDGTLQFDASLGMNNDIQFTTTAKGLKTHTDSGDTYLLTAYDVDGASHTTFFTFAAASSPTCTLTNDLTVANTKAIQPSTTGGQSMILKIYDTDGEAYVSGITFTNNSAPVVAVNQTMVMTAGKGIEFRTSGESIISSATGKLTISASAAGADDITLSGAITTDDDIVIANGKAIQPSTTGGQSMILKIYDTDGTAYVSGITFTNASAPVVAVNQTMVMDSGKYIEFRTSGESIVSGATGKLTIAASGTGADDITLDGTVTINDDVVIENGKAIQPTTTGGESMILKIYDTDGTAYVSGITLTNASAPVVAVNQTMVMTAGKGIEFRTSGESIISSATGKLTISASAAGADDITLSGAITTDDDIVIANGKAIQPTTTDGQSMVLKLYDTDGTAYVSGITFTNASAPVVAVNQTMVMTAGKGIEFRTSGESIISSATGKITIAGGGAGADDITLSGGTTCDDDMTFATGKGLQSGVTDTNTLTIAAYDVDGTAYSDMITVTSASAPSVALRIEDGITLNNNGSGGSVGVFVMMSSGSVISNSATGAVGTAEGYIAVNIENAIRYIYLFDNAPGA